MASRRASSTGCTRALKARLNTPSTRPSSFDSTVRSTPMDRVRPASGVPAGAARTTAKCYAKHQPAPRRRAPAWHRSGTAPPPRNVILCARIRACGAPSAPRGALDLVLSARQAARPLIEGREVPGSGRPPDIDAPPLGRPGRRRGRRDPAGGRHQRLPGQPQGPRLRGLRRRRARARAAARARSRDRLFDLLSKPSRSDALDVQTQVNAERADAEQLVERARGTDHPDELNDANGWLVEALEFRADAIEKDRRRSCRRRSATSGDSRAAINSIAGQMQALLASDVIYLQRTIPELDRGLRQARHRGAVPDRPLPARPRLARPGHRRDAARPDLGRTEPGRHARACTAPGSRASPSSRPARR